MEILSYHIASKNLLKLQIVGLWMISSCSSSSSGRPDYEDVVEGTISYPFYIKTNPVGKNGTEDKFVIRTINGSTEYIVEIPRAATDYEVAVPIAEIAAQSDDSPSPKIRNPQLTDKELTSQFPRPDIATQQQQALLDRAFGVAEKGGPRQSPSYTVGLAKLNKLYRKHQFEYALIEANNLISFYPNSSRLYKMKGSILVRLGNLRLAEKSWIRAAELSPSDPIIQKGLERLRKQIKSREMQLHANLRPEDMTQTQAASAPATKEESSPETEQLVNPTSDAPQQSF